MRQFQDDIVFLISRIQLRTDSVVVITLASQFYIQLTASARGPGFETRSVHFCASCVIRQRDESICVPLFQSNQNCSVGKYSFPQMEFDTRR